MYDAYPTCLNCTFIGEQLIIYEPVFARRGSHRQRDRALEPRPQPTSALALAVGPRPAVIPQGPRRGSRFAAPRHAPGPAAIEPRARERANSAPAQVMGPRTHVRFTRLSDPAPERSLAVALPGGPAPALAARAGRARAHPDAPGQVWVRSDVAVRGREREMPPAAGQVAVRSRAVGVARTGEGATQGVSRGVAIPREAWGYTRRTSLRR